MHGHAILTALVALVAVTAGNDREDKGITVRKCCKEYEVLSRNRTCVKADWPRSASMQRDDNGDVVPPLDAGWLRRWLPPGVPPTSIRRVKPHSLNRYEMEYYSNMVSVNTSSVWDEHKSFSQDVWRTQVVFWGEKYTARPRNSPGMHRIAEYCVDAAEAPLGPFVLLFKTYCSAEECVLVCCEEGKVLVNKGDGWKCEEDDKGYWSPINSSLAKEFHLDPEYPYETHDIPYFYPVYLATREQRFARRGHRGLHHLLFYTWQFCIDYYRSNSTLREGVFFSEFPRLVKGIYWLLRPLCAVSALLLAVALLSIACDRSMRRKVHGWCLANHAVCLFGFNAGQIVYYVTISDNIFLQNKREWMVPVDLLKKCTHLALWMYFLLMAAWFWLTILCINMAQGFRLQVALPTRSGKKKFLIFSGIAWGLPAVMTILCSFLFRPPVGFFMDSSAPWYTPSLMEARVCFTESPYRETHLKRYDIHTFKSGTALFYFGPVCCLVFSNVISLVIALTKMQRLRRGNSILRREEDMTCSQNEESASHATRDKTKARSHGSGSTRTVVDAKTIKLYLKMILMTGVIEIICEIIIWCNTRYSNAYNSNFLLDFHFPYRTSGHVTDFLRAACVAWLAAPEGGYLRPFF